MDLLTYLEKSPCSFWAVENLRALLLEQEYEPLAESAHWHLRVGGKYVVTRNDSSLLAFRVPSKDFSGFMLGAAHDESPSYKVKREAELWGKEYVQVAVEPYGSMIPESWLDTPLSVAGRLLVREENGLAARLVNVDKDLLLIPRVAIHLQNKTKESKPLNPAVDMQPLYRTAAYGVDFLAEVADAAGVGKQEILSFDLFLYNRAAGVLWGQEGCFLSAPRVDDLVGVYAAFTGFCRARENPASVPVLAVFDNEEVGSGTKQGACSTFLADTLRRISAAFGGEGETHLRRLANSFLLSVDNGHALHPNHPELADKNHAPVLNGGVIIKQNAAQHYCTDGVSDAVVRLLCQEGDIPYQYYYNRADLRGGQTLGNLSNTQVSVNGADVGLAQLAMHSAFETVGARDVERLCKLLTIFYGKAFREENGSFIL